MRSLHKRLNRACSILLSSEGSKDACKLLKAATANGRPVAEGSGISCTVGDIFRDRKDTIYGTSAPVGLLECLKQFDFSLREGLRCMARIRC